MHVTKSLGTHDMIIGRGIPKFLNINLWFSDEMAAWDGAELPFNDGDTSAKSDPAEDGAHRVKRILDAECEKADIEKICLEQAELDEEQRDKSATLLRKCEALFDGQHRKALTVAK